MRSDPASNGKGYPILANANIPANHVRMLDVTDQINDPKQNVIDQSFSGSTGLIMAYAQSFLREEVGKMYRGELVLRGIPEIEPMDVLLLMDPSTGMVGPIEVETVTHVMNIEEGFVTIIKPRAVVPSCSCTGTERCSALPCQPPQIRKRLTEEKIVKRVEGTHANKREAGYDEIYRPLGLSPRSGSARSGKLVKSV